MYLIVQAALQLLCGKCFSERSFPMSSEVAFPSFFPQREAAAHCRVRVCIWAATVKQLLLWKGVNWVPHLAFTAG